jgi:hypothetical protein
MVWIGTEATPSMLMRLQMKPGDDSEEAVMSSRPDSRPVASATTN